MERTQQPWPDEWPQGNGDWRRKQKPQWESVRAEALQAHRQAYAAQSAKTEVALPQAQAPQSPVKQPPSYNLLADVQQRQQFQEQHAQEHFNQQLSAIAQHWQKRWQEYSEAMDNAKQLFQTLLLELPLLAENLNDLLVPEVPITQPINHLVMPPKLYWRIDTDRSVGILTFMGLSISFMLCDNEQPLVLPRVGRSPLLCARLVALQGDMLDVHSPLYALDLADLLTFELASLYVSADPNAPVVMRLISDNPAQVSEELFFYPQQAPKAFLAKLLDRLGQCPQFHETSL